MAKKTTKELPSPFLKPRKEFHWSDGINLDTGNYDDSGYDRWLKFQKDVISDRRLEADIAGPSTPLYKLRKNLEKQNSLHPRYQKRISNLEGAIHDFENPVKEVSLSKKLFSKKNMLIGGGILASGIILKSLLASKEKYNATEGLHPGSNGFGAQSIRRHSDFGSGYRGMPTNLRGADIDPTLLDFRADVIDDKEKRKALRAELKGLQDKASGNLGSFKEEDFQKNLRVIKGLNLRNQKLREINLDKFKVNIEDADTLILQRKGLSGLFSKDVVIRLGGIDAPEIASHEDDPLEPVRIWQKQAGGEAATEKLKKLAAKQKHLSLVIGGEKTYGRYVGAFMGDQSILNVDLARSGDVAALPFGESEKDVISRSAIKQASQQARREESGIWGFARYKAIHEAQKKIGQSITFNTFTRKDKLAQNLNLSAYGSFLESFGEERRDLTSQEQHIATRLGYSLRKTHGPHKRAYNKTDGMHPGSQGIGAQMVRAHSEFGSGYQGIKNFFGSIINKGSSKRAMKAAIAAEEFAPQVVAKKVLKPAPVETAFNRLEKVLANPNKPFSKENIVELSKLAKTDTLEEFMGRLNVVGRPGLKEELGQAGFNFMPAKRIEELGGFEALGSDPIKLPSLLKEHGLEFGTAYVDTGLIKALPKLSEGIVSVRQAEDFGKTIAFHEATELRNSERYLAKHYREGLDFRHEAAVAQEEFFVRSRKDRFSYNEFLSLRSFSDPEYTGYKQGLKLATGEKASHNTIEGLRHGGLAEDVRKALTDFGSGYQGLRKLFRGTAEKATVHKPMINLGKLDEANKAVEHFFEAVRTKEFPHRPSRLNSSYWSPKKEMARQYAKGKNAHLSSVSVKDSNLFVTDNEAFISGGLALHDPFGGGETAALSYARDYWKGVSYEKALKLKAPEALLPGATKANKTWSANKTINEIEGLHPKSEGLGTQQVRKHSEFGSGYQGIKNFFGSLFSRKATLKKSALAMSEELSSVLSNPKATFSQSNILELADLAGKESAEKFMSRLGVANNPRIYLYGEMGVSFMHKETVDSLGIWSKALKKNLKQGKTKLGHAYINKNILNATSRQIGLSDPGDLIKYTAFHEAAELRNSTKLTSSLFAKEPAFHHRAAVAQEELFLRRRGDPYLYEKARDFRIDTDPEYTGYKQGLKLATGDKASHNTIEGLRHGGLAEDVRKALTDFGSGYQGLERILSRADYNKSIEARDKSKLSISDSIWNLIGFKEEDLVHSINKQDLMVKSRLDSMINAVNIFGKVKRAKAERVTVELGKWQDQSIRRNKRFAKHSENSVGIGFRSAYKAGKGHCNYSSTGHG